MKEVGRPHTSRDSVVINFLSLSKESSLKVDVQLAALKRVFRAKTQNFLSLSKESSLKVFGMKKTQLEEILLNFLSLSKESSLKV